MLRFTVLGKPEALSRPRAVRRGAHADVYQPIPTWMGLVSLRAAEERKKRGSGFIGPVLVQLRFHMPRPKRIKDKHGRHVTKPDIDNCIKATIDALVPILLSDDKAIVELYAAKRYAMPEEAAGCEITIEEATA